VIVCICKFVSEGAVRAARRTGARTLEAIAAATGAGTGCDCCHGTIQKVLAQPCGKAVPCPGCPRHAAASEAVPARIAAEGVKVP